MIKIFNKIKAWQLFLIFILYIFAPSHFFILRVLACLSFEAYLVWLYYIVDQTSSVFKKYNQVKYWLFKSCCLVGIIVSPLLILLQNVINLIWIEIHMSLFLFFYICVIYMVVYATIRVSDVIYRRDDTIPVSLIVFFALWIYPLGVWYLHPIIQIRKLDLPQ